MFDYEKKLQLSVMWGADVTSAIKEAINISKTQNVIVSFNFNGVEIVVDQNSTYEETFKDWVIKTEKLRSERERLPEYAEKQRNAELIRQDAQNNLERIMASIDTIDFTNLEQLLPILSQIVTYGNYQGVNYDWQNLNDLLQAGGYYKNMNCDSENYKLDIFDKEATGKWIVGQVMNCGYPTLALMIDTWTQKFVKQPMEEEIEKPKTL